MPSKTNKQKSNCFTLSLAHRYTSASLVCDLGHFPLPVPTKATLYPLTIVLRPLPAPLGSSTENLEPVRCGLPQRPTHRPANFSNTALPPFLTPRLSLEMCCQFNSNPSPPVVSLHLSRIRTLFHQLVSLLISGLSFSTGSFLQLYSPATVVQIQSVWNSTPCLPPHISS